MLSPPNTKERTQVWQEEICGEVSGLDVLPCAKKKQLSNPLFDFSCGLTSLKFKTQSTMNNM